MYVFLSTLILLIIVSTCILLLFNLRNRLGLAPLYILLGGIQYFQINLEYIEPYKILGEFPVFPQSIVLFSAMLFAVLLLYIKEGVVSARTLIIAILISSLFIIGLFEISALQDYFIRNANRTEDINFTLFPNLNFKIFFIGTFLLFFDFILITSIYQFLISKFHKEHYFLILFLSLWLVLIFDAFTFYTVLFVGTSKYTSSLIGNFIAKTLSAIIFSLILYIYLKYVDKVFETTSFIANQNREVLSILNYKKKYLDLKVEKKISEKKISAQYEKTLTSISDGITTLDSNWCYTYVNQQAGKFVGRTPESLMGKHIWTEFPDVVSLPFYNACLNAFKSQKAHISVEYFSSYGKWFENRIYPTSDGLTIYFTDITEKKEIEKALVESEAFNKGILSSLTAHIAVIDKTGEVLAVNKAWNDYSVNNGGYNYENTSVGSNYIEVCKHAISEGDVLSQNILDGLKSVLNQETRHFEIEYPCHYKDEKRWFTMHVEPFGTESDKLVISHNSITQLKIAEEKLERTNLKLKEAQRMAKLGNWEYNPVTKEIFFSDEIYQIFELDKNSSQDLYESYKSKCILEDQDAINELVSNAIKNKTGYTIGYYIKSSEVSQKYIQEVGEVVKDENNNVILKGTIQDITKDKLISDELTQSNEELLKINTELDRFVYSASHDLRSPLTSLQGLIQVLEMQIDTSGKVDKEPIKLMTQTIDKMDKFIADILDYSLNTRTELTYEKINFEALIKSSWEDLKYMDLNYKPKLSLDIKQNVDFLSDPKRISIILNNLISNAFKYHDKNKTNHFINILIDVDDKKVIIDIEDNGIGIEQEYIDKIFDMFHRATTLSTGSGMGLYIVKETIEKLKGSIHVTSKLEKGTKFSIKLPNSL
ncbi:ATP-binding protein [Maribacter aquivivus]|uniref:ATP-binding protein n=1 Tax=Maribacter aquivivus TaxID=228958 RepID=UPI002490A96C|nr:ATP-binding protein [Maribacter aquivivus]